MNAKLNSPKVPAKERPLAIVKHFGGIRQTAEALGVTRQAVEGWLTREAVPPGKCGKILAACGARPVWVCEGTTFTRLHDGRLGYVVPVETD